MGEVGNQLADTDLSSPSRTSMIGSGDRIARSLEKRAATLPATVSVTPQDNRLTVVILQHPQEPDVELGSALLAARCLNNSNLKIGLSWRSPTAAIGPDISLKRWGVLYLGPKPKWQDPREVVPVSRKGSPLEGSLDLDGLVVLDGTWSQVKTLWWRNPWLLKLQRLVLQPKVRSRYGSLRKEPRADCVSTIEAIAAVLRSCGEKESIPAELEASFDRLLKEFRSQQKAKSSTHI